MNTQDFSGVFVFAQQVDGQIARVTFELLGKARELAADLEGEVTALLLGHDIAPLAPSLCEGGADRVVVIDDPALRHYATLPYAQALSAAIERYRPAILLFGATAISS